MRARGAGQHGAAAPGDLRRGLDLRCGRRLRPRVLRGPGPALGLPARDSAARWPTRSTSARTGRRGASSWRGSRARSPSAAPSTCCATGSSTGRTTSTSSTARPRRATRRPPSATPQNRFSVTRQLRYSRDETQRALDLGLFINGLPVATFELKNSLTKQTVADAVEQYKRDRDPREKLFEFGRCVVHFAVDDHEVRFCTHLKGKGSWFLPFNQGWNDGAGNPPNPDGLKTDYLWKRDPHPRRPDRHPRELRPGRRDEGREDRQEEARCRSCRASTSSTWCAGCSPTRGASGAGRRYLIQHSAGSGKSNSIAWLAHQLIGLEKDERDGLRLDHRRHRPPHPRPADPRHHQAVRPGGRDGRARRALGRSAQVHRRAGKKIIISTVQKFPFILDEIGERAPRADASPSSSTRRTPARAGGPRPRCRMALADGRGRGGRRDARGHRSTG